jgi:flagellar motor protein MotB
MADYDGVTPGTVLADASVAEFISELGLGIAKAQRALDDNSVDQLAEYIAPIDSLGGRSLLDLGMSPAFYHYQHADISLSMQVSLKVEKNVGVKLNLSGSHSTTSTSNDDSNETSSSSSSGSSNSTSTSTAKIEIEAASAGALTVDGITHQLTGASPRERIKNLKTALKGDGGSVIPWVFTPPSSTPVLTSLDVHPDDVDKVLIGGNTVAFMFGAYNAALVQVVSDAETTYALNPSNSATVAAGLGVPGHADKLAADVVAMDGYRATVFGSPDKPAVTAHFDTSFQDEFDNEADRDMIRFLAKACEAAGIDLTVEGFADRQQFSTASEVKNNQLGQSRGDYVISLLKEHGYTRTITHTPSEGDQAAIDNGDAIRLNNRAFRKVEITTTQAASLVYLERTDDAKPAIAKTATPNTGSDNKFVGFLEPLDTHQFKLASKVKLGTAGNPADAGLAARGPAPDGTLAARTATQHAEQLAARINGDSTTHTANHEGNVVRVFNRGDKFSLMLVSTSNQTIKLTGSNSVSVTEQFKKSDASTITSKKTGNRSTAIAASVDVGYSRKFEVSVTGNSAISARLVSLPAPPAFLEVIKEFLAEG